MTELTEQPKDRWWTEDFYNSNPRSRQIRESCLPILDAIDRLLYDPKTADDPEKKKDFYALIEAQNGKLIELDIRPGMHVGKTKEDFKTNPIMAAEYVAGQLFYFMGVQIPSETKTVQLLQEHQEFEEVGATGPILVRPDKLTPRARNFKIAQSVLNTLRDYLDAERKQ